jgi:signal peptidase I
MISLTVLLVLIGANLAIGSGKLKLEKVISESMEPTLMVGDTLLVDANGFPDRYTVVVLNDPEEADGKLVKRIIGMPGDRLKIQGGIIYLNGQEEYSTEIEANAVETPDMRVTVPAGKIFVMGDNRNNSADSREFGAVPIESIVGTVKAVIWPPSRWCKPKPIH